VRDPVLASLLQKLAAHEDLSADEASTAMAEIMAGQATPALISGFLVALAMKGERPEEIYGLARTMRREALPFDTQGRQVFDTCGTGGDRSGTFNISSAAAVVLAACGVVVAKHGNRSVSSQCGSADVFEALGVQVTGSPATASRCLAEAGLTFLFAPTFHPSMRHAGPTRRELGLRTAFNLLGPLTNPAAPRRQLVGVPRPELTELIARALQLLGSERAWVVHGADGIDEISLAGHTKVSECWDGAVRTFYVHPSDFGLRKAPVSTLAGGDAAQNAALIVDILNGTKGARRDVVLLNVAAGLFVEGRVPTVRDGLEVAAEAIDSGRARATLDALVSASRAAEGEAV
jgi:anthranilate phosphoribosyltransferase